MRTRPDYYYRQSAVIPYRHQEGRLEVLVVTSRKRKRWVIPKGIREPGLDAGASAAKEASEEAGVTGAVARPAIGRYRYEKWGGVCSVEVYAMRVEQVYESWPEDFRDREWVDPEEAAARVEEPELKRLLRSLSDFLSARPN